MLTTAVVFESPGTLDLRELELSAPEPRDVVVEVEWTGISTGTERLLYTGQMPPFPGMGYPLVPGYEAVGHVVEAGPESGRRVGEFVFIAGARCFPSVRCLFGSSAHRLVVPGSRAIPLDVDIGEEGILLALAATAYHALVDGNKLPELIVGHGALGRLMARLVLALGGSAPVVWDNNVLRRTGATGYRVIEAADDARRDYACIADVSGDVKLTDTLISRLGQGGELVLAGFYHDPISFAFPPAFMRGARLRIANEWQPSDLVAVRDLVETGCLSLGGLISHRRRAAQAAEAYAVAFGDPTCVKMLLDWREAA